MTDPSPGAPRSGTGPHRPAGRVRLWGPGTAAAPVRLRAGRRAIGWRGPHAARTGVRAAALRPGSHLALFVLEDNQLPHLALKSSPRKSRDVARRPVLPSARPWAPIRGTCGMPAWGPGCGAGWATRGARSGLCAASAAGARAGRATRALPAAGAEAAAGPRPCPARASLSLTTPGHSERCHPPGTVPSTRQALPTGIVGAKKRRAFTDSSTEAVVASHCSQAGFAARHRPWAPADEGRLSGGCRKLTESTGRGRRGRRPAG